MDICTECVYWSLRMADKSWYDHGECSIHGEDCPGYDDDEVIKALKKYEQLQKAVNTFCEKSEWGDSAWKKQEHIAELFRLREKKELQVR